MERLQLLQDFFLTTVQYEALEKIEVGGLRGKTLSHNVSQVNAEFSDLFYVFKSRTYDCLDPDEAGFIKDVEHFNLNITGLDRKLGAILSRALEDCKTSDSIFKLIHVFEGILGRKLISRELNDHISCLISSLKNETGAIEVTMDKQKKMARDFGGPVVDRNMPRVTGHISLIREMKLRLQRSLDNLKNLNHPIIEGKDAAELMMKASAMIQGLDAQEDEIYKVWSNAANKNTLNSLNHPLLKRISSSNTLEVNFGKQLLEILFEVQVLKKDFPEKAIPEEAEKVYARYTNFRHFNSTLEKVVDLYNYLILNCIPEEFKLIEEDMNSFDNDLQPAENTLTWMSLEIKDYILGLKKKILNINQRVRKAKENLQKIKDIVKKWIDQPMFQRIDGDSRKLLDLEGMKKSKEKRYNEISKCSDQLQQLLKEISDSFLINVKIRVTSKRWRAYLRFVDNILIEALLYTIASSLGYLLDNTDEKKKIEPLFELQLELFHPTIIFRPPLDERKVNNFFDMTTDIVDDIYKMAELFPRIAKVLAFNCCIQLKPCKTGSQ